MSLEEISCQFFFFSMLADSGMFDSRIYIGFKPKIACQSEGRACPDPFGVRYSRPGGGGINCRAHVVCFENESPARE